MVLSLTSTHCPTCTGEFRSWVFAVLPLTSLSLSCQSICSSSVCISQLVLMSCDPTVWLIVLSPSWSHQLVDWQPRVPSKHQKRGSSQLLNVEWHWTHSIPLLDAPAISISSQQVGSSAVCASTSLWVGWCGLRPLYVVDGAQFYDEFSLKRI